MDRMKIGDWSLVDEEPAARRVGAHERVELRVDDEDDIAIDVHAAGEAHLSIPHDLLTELLIRSAAARRRRREGQR